jgi:sulfur-oxidizing protein SoxY
MERRSFLRGCVAVGATGAACSTGLLTSNAAIANGSDPFEATSVDAVLKSLGADGVETSNQIKITAPKVAEDGASVPVAISSTIQGTTEIITIVSTNPKPLAARNRFGKGAVTSVSSRLKMGKTTEVIAVVRAGEMHYMAKTDVKVTVGGCGG